MQLPYARGAEQDAGHEFAEHHRQMESARQCDEDADQSGRGDQREIGKRHRLTRLVVLDRSVAHVDGGATSRHGMSVFSSVQ